MLTKNSVSSPPKDPFKAGVRISAKGSRLKTRNTSFFGFDFGTVRRWVALEERIIQDCQQKEMSPVRTEAKAPVMKPAGEPATTPLPAKAAKSPKTRLPWAVIVFWAFWLGAVIFALFYFRANYFNGKTVSLPEVPFGVGQNKSTSLAASQTDTIRQLKKEIQGLNQGLRAAQKTNKELQTREQDYRDELYQLTLKYEEELSNLRQANLANENLIRNLQPILQKAQENFEETGQGFPGARFSGPAFPAGADNPSFGGRQTVGRQNAGIQGKVVMVNNRYEFVILDVGAQQGVRIGQNVVFYKNGREFVPGKIERVYPMLSGAAVFDRNALADIQEGDSVAVMGY